MNKSDDTALLLGQLTRIADALERQTSRIDIAPDALAKGRCLCLAVRYSAALSLLPRLIGLILVYLKGINEQRDDLLSNTLGFVAGISGK